MLNTDILIAGAGIVGLSVAREIAARYPDITITILEKEPTLARHASGRNSGVLHAGFYYSPDSLKAKFVVDGNRLLTQYCLENGLSINRCGKVVVAKNENEIESLYELKRRGDSNGVAIEIVDEAGLSELEPNAKTVEKALYSPSTSTIIPSEVVECIGSSLMKKKNVRILFNERLLKRNGSASITTNSQKITFSHLINTAGLYADKVAHEFGAGMKYSLIPFKGLYLEYESPDLIRKHIYPVPDIDNPFLGMHFTKSADGHVKAGPTAIPAFWRENYSGLSNFSLSEALEILPVEAKLFAHNSFNFRKIAFEELRKYYRKNFISLASRLVKTIDERKFGRWLTPGIRAQLYNRKQCRLEMDFVVEEAENSTHVLNAVSPAFTCAFSFSRFVADEVEKRLNKKR
ncbi:MAG: L-2-hydroxyglutarate oxidase [Candidatus Schekmanbacteria bacterium]|nr:L-2-hydroxyglutarate oxidase [Candidatus Schekmanbacteria bacterium]